MQNWKEYEFYRADGDISANHRIFTNHCSRHYFDFVPDKVKLSISENMISMN